MCGLAGGCIRVAGYAPSLCISVCVCVGGGVTGRTLFAVPCVRRLRLQGLLSLRREAAAWRRVRTAAPPPPPPLRHGADVCHRAVRACTHCYDRLRAVNELSECLSRLRALRLKLCSAQFEALRDDVLDAVSEAPAGSGGGGARGGGGGGGGAALPQPVFVGALSAKQRAMTEHKMYSSSYGHQAALARASSGLLGGPRGAAPPARRTARDGGGGGGGGGGDRGGEDFELGDEVGGERRDKSTGGNRSPVADLDAASEDGGGGDGARADGPM